MSKEEALSKLKACKNFYEFLATIKETTGLRLVDDNGWSWVEFNGEKIENSEKERFTSSTEMSDLFKLAGISKPK